MSDCHMCVHKNNRKECDWIECDSPEANVNRWCYQAWLILVLFGFGLVFLGIGVGSREEHHATAGNGTVIEPAIVYYGGDRPTIDEANRLVEAYK